MNCAQGVLGLLLVWEGHVLWARPGSLWLFVLVSQPSWEGPGEAVIPDLGQVSEGLLAEEV